MALRMTGREWRLLGSALAGLAVVIQFLPVGAPRDNPPLREEPRWSSPRTRELFDRVPEGQWVELNDPIGHASCEGGLSTGTHLHFARKYNGEWITADGPVPFVLSGWTAVAGEKPYQGKLVKGNRVITADLYAQLRALIYREPDGE